MSWKPGDHALMLPTKAAHRDGTVFRTWGTFGKHVVLVRNIPLSEVPPAVKASCRKDIVWWEVESADGVDFPGGGTRTNTTERCLHPLPPPDAPTKSESDSMDPGLRKVLDNVTKAPQPEKVKA
jgi:hypothetical protein